MPTSFVFPRSNPDHYQILSVDFRFYNADSGIERNEARDNSEPDPWDEHVEEIVAEFVDEEEYNEAHRDTCGNQNSHCRFLFKLGKLRKP